jgi:DNA-binding transcriptional regulator YhcF (GntR family)
VERLTESRPRRQPRDGKVDRIVKHVVHAIATGNYTENEKLPSIRQAEALWSTGRLTVLKAYQELTDMGLVRKAPRSGFFVAASPRVERVSRYRVELERLMDGVVERIRGETGLSPLGALRYMARLAESRAREEPECAFVECTRFQAGGHAAEIEARLGVPCRAMSTSLIGGSRRRIPAHVRVLLTTAFHRAEVEPLADPPNLECLEVPIRFARRSAERLARLHGRLVVLGIDLRTVEEIAADVETLIDRESLDLVMDETSLDGLDEAVRDHLYDENAPGEQPEVLLSPSLWEAAPENWRAHPRVHPVEYEIHEDAWPQVADALGLPLGEME